MVTIEQQIEQLQIDKQTLVDNLVAKGVEATNDETFTMLVPKVADIQAKFAPPYICFMSYTGTELDLTNLNTSKITSMKSMFSGCSNLTSINLSAFDTSNVTNMEMMFRGASKLTTLDVSSFDTSKVTSMSEMFANCSNLKTVNISKFNTNELKKITYIFDKCTNLSEIDISVFANGYSYNTSRMLSNCSNLKKVIINSTKFLAMSSIDMVQSSAITNGTGYVYVPDDMVEIYKTATNWSTYASQIKPISELEGYENA